MMATEPNRFVNRSATSPPPIAPIAPIAISAPYQRSLRCSRSCANSTKIAAVICMPSTDRLAAIASPRSTRWRDSQRRPSAISTRKRRRFGSAGVTRGVVVAWMVSTRQAAIAKLAASKPNGSHIAATKSTLPIGVPTKLLAAISAAIPSPVGLLEQFDGDDRGHHRLRGVVEEHLCDTQASRQRATTSRSARCVCATAIASAPTGDGPEGIGANHEQAVVEAIDQRTDRQREQQPRQGSGDTDERDRQLAAREARGKQRKGDQKHPVAEVGDRACRPQTPVGRRKPSRYVSGSHPGPLRPRRPC